MPILCCRCEMTVDPTGEEVTCEGCGDELGLKIRAQHQLLTRCRRELNDVLHSINKGKVYFDGDDFHELLRDLDEALSPKP